MKKTRLLILAAVFLALSAIPLLAQEAGVIVADADRTASPLDDFALKVLPILAAAFTITKLIDGMKNHPFFGAFFVKVPKLASILAGLMAFIPAAILCFQMEGGLSLMMVIHCIVIAGGTALLAAGFNASEKRKLAAAGGAGVRTLGVTDTTARVLTDEDVLPPMRKEAERQRER